MIGRNTPRLSAASPILLQYASGKVMARPFGKNTRFNALVGWHIQMERWPELDAALQEVKTPMIEIKHQRPGGGGGDIVPHWSFGEEINLLPITSGPVATTIQGCFAGDNPRLMRDSGIGLSWHQNEKSRLAIRCIALPVWNAGVTDILQLTVRGHMTAALLDAMIHHDQVLRIADEFAEREVTPAELFLPLGPGEETEVGKKDTSTIIPMVSYHPNEITKDYIDGMFCSPKMWERACAEWDGIIAWAHQFGVEQPATTRVVDTETGEVEDVPQTFANRRNYGRH